MTHIVTLKVLVVIAGILAVMAGVFVRHERRETADRIRGEENLRLMRESFHHDPPQQTPPATAEPLRGPRTEPRNAWR